MPLLTARIGSRLALSLAGWAVIMSVNARADAQRIENQVAVFAALDKVTARISRLEVKLGDSVKFGALKVKPLRCYSRAPDEPPKTTAFVQVTETQLDGSEKSLFSGWMFAESPGLDAVEHPVYDVWLTECAAPIAVRVATPASGAGPARQGGGAAPRTTDDPVPPAGPADDSFRRRRPPR